ncbi:MAG TPA: hypothetical protein VMG59_02325 [Phycisphaerae bacterium]|nr:hypothetical protein [Phycisphaerae bacterium]
MFYVGATDQRVSVVNELGSEVYSTDFRNMHNVLILLRGVIAGIALANSMGEVDPQLVRVLQKQMEKEKGFKNLTTHRFEPHLDARLLALSALASTQSGGTKTAKKKK